MRAADAIAGAASPHAHPRVEAAAVAPLLERAGFVRPVVDVDRVPVAYSSLDRLVGDLRRMGATNVLEERSRTGLSKAARSAAIAAFAEGRPDGRDIRDHPFHRVEAHRFEVMDDRPLTLSAGRLVNRAAFTPAAWTWTRGGWRERYPKDFAQATRGYTRCDRYRIRADCALIIIAMMGGLQALGGGTNGMWGKIKTAVESS